MTVHSGRSAPATTQVRTQGPCGSRALPLARQAVPRRLHHPAITAVLRKWAGRRSIRRNWADADAAIVADALVAIYGGNR